MIGRFRKKETAVAVIEAPAAMSEAEADIIRRYAAGEGQLRQQAICIHHRYISILGVRGTTEMRFMAEVDNPAPDISLRLQYRQELLKGDNPLWR